MTFFEELKEKIQLEKNCNFHLTCLDLTTQVWIQELCDLIDEKLIDKVVECDCTSNHKSQYILGNMYCHTCGKNLVD